MAKPFTGTVNVDIRDSEPDWTLLTGRNHTRNSMACITEAAIGFPNGSGTKEWIEKFRGRFDMGYEAIRADIQWHR